MSIFDVYLNYRGYRLKKSVPGAVNWLVRLWTYPYWIQLDVMSLIHLWHL